MTDETQEPAGDEAGGEEEPAPAPAEGDAPAEGGDAPAADAPAEGGEDEVA
jgi:hypothetical protein